MNDEQKAAFVFAQSVCAMAEIEAMKALNWEREQNGHSLAYGEDAFFNVIDKYCIGHNAVLSLFGSMESA